MPDSSAFAHFFTPLNTLTQLPGQEFGPASPEVFRITSSFNANGAKAFSICKGVVLVVKQVESTTKVNLVLKPFKQPFPGLNIKYFIYRGLNKSDFFEGANITSDENPSGFITQIKSEYQSFKEAIEDKIHPVPDIPPLTPKSIGYDEAFTGTIPLADFFYKESDYVSAGDSFDETDAFELPMIAAGKSLGTFLDTNSGIDVVLHYGDYKHNFDNGEFNFSLGYASLAEATISLTGLTDTEKRLKREQSTQFIDIAAFYGLFAATSAKVEVMNGEDGEYRTSNAIYTDVLTPFRTKNRWYIYIQGDRTRSYNFYGNYKIADNDNHPMKAGTIADSLLGIDYGTHGWPLLIDDQTTTGSAGENSYYIQLATDNNPNTALFGKLGKITNSKQNNFSDAEDLRLPLDSNGNPKLLTKAIQLSTMAVAEGSNMKNIAALSIILYQGMTYTYIVGQELNEDNEPENIVATPNFFDDVFDLINSEPLLKVGEDTTFSKMTSEKSKLVNHYYNNKQYGISVVQTVTINDSIETGLEEAPTVARVTYSSEVSATLQNPATVGSAVNAPIKTTASVNSTLNGTKTFTVSDSYYYNLRMFTDNSSTITGVEIKATDGSIPGIIILGITKEENDQIKLLITNTIKNPRLLLFELFQEDKELTSIENVKYQKYKLALVYEDISSTIMLKTIFPAQDIIIYSLDRNYHFTSKYSEHMAPIGTVDLTLDYDLIVL
jgi:hypothetical protein